MGVYGRNAVPQSEEEKASLATELIMPPLHSSPHPRHDLDLNVDWNPKEEFMENPYPNVGGVQPGYDRADWAGGENPAGRNRHPFTTQSQTPVWAHASQFDTGSGRRARQGHSHSHGNQRHSQHSHQHMHRGNMTAHPWPHLQRASSLDGSRIPDRSSRARFSSDEEDPAEFDEEYDSYDEGEPAFLPPKMGRGRGHGRAWDSSDGEEFEDDPEDEEYFDEEDSDSYSAEVRANMHQHGGNPMPRRGHPHPHQHQHQHQHHGGMRRSSPPPLETPPQTPPPLARGMPFPRGRGRDPRMMGGRGMGPHVMDRGGVRMAPVRGGPPHGGAPHGRGVPIPRGRVNTKHTRFMDSPPSSSGGLGHHLGSARVRRSNGGSIKKMMRWLTNGEYINLFHFCSRRFLPLLYSFPMLGSRITPLIPLSRYANKAQPFSPHRDSFESSRAHRVGRKAPTSRCPTWCSCRLWDG